MALNAEALFTDPREVYVVLVSPDAAELRAQPGYSRLQLNEWRRIASWTAVRTWDQKVAGYRLYKMDPARYGHDIFLGDGLLFENNPAGLQVNEGDTINIHFDFKVDNVPLGVFQAMWTKVKEAYASGQEPHEQSIDWRRVVEL